LFLALLLTKSLGAFFSLFVGLGLYFYLKENLAKKQLVLLGCVIVAFVFVFIWRQKTNNEFYLPSFSLMQRVTYWKETAKIIMSHPLIGIGMGNFNLNISRYAHNSYLQIWAEMGILGLSSFLWLLSSIFKSCSQRSETSYYKNQIPGLTAACAVFLIHNLIDFSFFLPEISLSWWIILGILFSYHRQLQDPI
jgi:O-antigen ligase